MAKQKNDIQSTERLLKIIREKDTISIPEDSPQSPSCAIKAQKSTLIKSVSFKKKATVGVDIGHTNIRLAKLIRAEKSYQLVDYLDVPLSKTVSLKDPKFKETLRTTMARFCGDAASVDIWGAIHSANVEIRCIHIPKLQRKQLANAIYWTFAKKVPFNEDLEVLDYELRGEINVGGIKKLEVLTFKAPREDISEFRATFQEIGFTLKGISIVPFAIQNLFRTQTIPLQDKDACCLFIGRDWSRIAIYNKGRLVLSRGIKAGMRSMIEAINSTIQRGSHQQRAANAGDALQSETDHSTTAIHPRAQQIFIDFIGATERPAENSPKSDSLDPPQVFQMVLPAMERLVRQVERTFEHYALNFNREGISRIYISGQVIANAVILDYIGKQLDLPVTPMNPFSDERGFSSQVRVPGNVSEREGYVPAIGLALSDNNITPNFLYTHENKQDAESVRRNNMRILTVCMLLLMLMVGIFSWQQNQLDAKRDDIEKLDNKLLTYSPPAEKKVLLALFAKTKSKRQSVSQIIDRYAPIAVVSELSQITPSNIRLLNIDALLEKADAKRARDTASTLQLEGVIFGEPETFETSLTSYMLNLKNSPMFLRPNLRSKQIEYYENKQVLRFSTTLEII